MQFIAVGSAAVAAFTFTKNGVPTTPANAPTITAAYYNGTLLSPLPAMGSPTNPGEYTPTVFTTLQTTATGYYFAIAYTADATMDNQISIEDWTVGAVVADPAGVTTLLARLGAITGSGANTILGLFRALMRNDATLPSDVGGTYDPATDSTQAIRGAMLTSTQTAQAVHDAVAASYDTAGTIGEKINTGGSVGDPLENSPSDYIDGQIGYNLDYRLSAIYNKIGTTAIALVAPVVGFQIIPLVTNRSYKDSLGNPITFSVSGLAFDLTDPGITIKMNVAVLASTPTPFTGTASSATEGFIDVDPTDTVDWLPDGAPKTFFAAELIVYNGVEPVSIIEWRLPVVAGVGT